MKIVVITITALICLAGCEGATTTTTTVAPPCQSSSQCNYGQCCRDGENRVIGDSDYPWMDSWVYEGTTGTCVTGLAQQGEVCDTNCQCAAGLECYRPMSGACCPPQTCMDAAYVQQQRDYWNNCHPPDCAFPP